MSYNTETGRVYIDETTTPKTGIGIPDICKAVGYSSGDLGTLIDKGIINAYSKVKPVRSAAHQIDDYGTVDISYGFALNEIITPSLTNAFNNCKEYKYWEKFYLRPRGVQITDTTIEQYVERYRFLDFNGYWKYAPHPYKYNNIKDIVFYTTKNNFKDTPQYFSFSINSKAEIFITSFKALLENGDESTLSKWKYGMLVGDSGGTLSFVGGDSLTDISTDDPTTDDVTKSFGVKFNDTGTFSLCFVATKYTGGDDIAVETAWLDGGFHTVNISQKRIPIDVDVVTYNLTAEYIYDDYGYVGIRLNGLSEVHNYSFCRSDITATNLPVYDTNGGLNAYIDVISTDGKIIASHSYDIIGESFSYSGKDRVEKAVDVQNPILFDKDSGLIDPDKLDNIKHLKVRITPYTEATDDNNGEFRWANGVTSQEYTVEFIV